MNAEVRKWVNENDGVYKISEIISELATSRKEARAIRGVVFRLTDSGIIERVGLGTYKTLKRTKPRKRVAGFVPTSQHSCTDVVYFLQGTETGVIYIGQTSDLHGRLSQHARSNWDSRGQRLLAYVPGGISKEREIHNMFSNDLIHNSTFKPSMKLLEFINNIDNDASLMQEIV